MELNPRILIPNAQIDHGFIYTLHLVMMASLACMVVKCATLPKRHRFCAANPFHNLEKKSIRPAMDVTIFTLSRHSVRTHET